MRGRLDRSQDEELSSGSFGVHCVRLFAAEGWIARGHFWFGEIRKVQEDRERFLLFLKSCLEVSDEEGFKSVGLAFFIDLKETAKNHQVH